MKPPYQREGEHWLVELRLAHPGQLFLNLDPSPFPHRDLAPAVEQFIVEAVEDFPGDNLVKLVIHLPAEAGDGESPGHLQDTVRHYFQWRSQEARRQLRWQMREGRLSLIIGLAFMATCMLGRSLLASPDASLFAHTLSEGLLILGWVAMWRPVDTFLYGWWPTRQKIRLMDRIATLPLELRPDSSSASGNP